MNEEALLIPEIIIYVGPNCPYCVRAKALFDKLGIIYTIIDISTDDDLRKKMVDLSRGRTSVPQIFINNVHIGGYQDLYEIYQASKLDDYLKH